MKKIVFIAFVVFATNTKAQFITTVAGTGAYGYTGDGGQATAAGLFYPNAVAFDAAGNMYIADMGNQCIRKVNTAGIISTFAGTGGINGFSGDGGQATLAQLYSPSGIVFDVAGNLYISDNNNNRIRKVNTAGVISTVAGYTTTGGYSGDGGQATAAKLYYPIGVTFDIVGNLYISDNYNNRIRKVNTAGIISTVAGMGGGSYSGDGGQATAANLNQPNGVAFDAIGNMYIADQNNARIRKVNTAGIITTFAGDSTGGYSGDGGQATAAELAVPDGVTFDAAGNLYIADAYNNRVRMVNTAGIITTFAGNGAGAGTYTCCYGGDGGQPTAAEINQPGGVTFDAAGNLYIADWHNHVIRKVSMGSPTGIKQITNNNEQLTIYPNPNNGSFVIEPSGNTKQTMQVYDVNGKLVLSQTINGKTTIDASSLNEGVYNISIISSEGVVNKRLVIVR